jgi:hypothetical protein
MTEQLNTEAVENASAPAEAETEIVATETPVTNAKPAEEAAPVNEFSYEAWVAKQSEKDPSIAKQLRKFSSVDDLGKAWVEAQKRISEGYKLNLPEGIVVGEADKPLWDLFLNNANKLNLSQAELDKVAPAYYAMEKELNIAQDKQIKEAYRQNDAALREMWSSDMATNLSINEDFLTKTGGEQLVSLLSNAMGADNRPLANHPIFAKFLNEQARLSGFTKGMVYDAEGQQNKVEDEIQELMAKRTGMNRDKYYNQSNAAQRDKDAARLADLYNIRERMKK